MKIGMSFSSMLTKSFRGMIDLTIFDEFHFSAGRVHILRDDGNVPCEALWLNTEDRHLSHVRDDWVPLSVLEPAAAVYWNKFRGIVEKMDLKGKVHYDVGKRKGRHPHAKALLLKGHKVWMEYWISVDEVKYVEAALDYGVEKNRCCVCHFQIEADDLVCPECGRAK